MTTSHLPFRPAHLPEYSEACLQAMVALIERGAPRDFRDIYAICAAGLITPRECWELWERRQQAAGSDVDYARARLAVETHLTRIAQHRRLEQIADSAQRAEAEQVRTWFKGEFLHAGS